MSVIPCEQNADLREQIERFAEILKTQAHTLGAHGMDERDFYNSGLFRGAVERIRGQYSATMRPKREFAQHVLNYLEDQQHISGWEKTDSENRSDYWVRLKSGRNACISLTGALDGNNTTIFERPADADEFVVWSVMTNPGSDPRRNAWSGIHTRLGVEMISTGKRVDGLIVWDMVCGTSGRPCPKINIDGNQDRLTDIGPFRVPPTCVYVFSKIPPGVANKHATPQVLADIELLNAFHTCFQGRDEEVNYVTFDVEERQGEAWRKTTIMRGGMVQRASEMMAIRRG
ncbi:hypothetical protein GR211_36185 [Rhizobium leguminosarum]|uniref:hypothetical protein n=1 Tax=Rhizobium ruizarguesonis TaxID=2081791 RepID=UPI000949A3A8|nr:hypothetical protein [Rhizobium ruizarguesonis]NEJ17557.1 hypothetical protein [Rhizobium ruizarguesonis]NEK32255.1 hypothetical protein [Rhizobium ruizarguesonis]UED32558.1 hypothetical protein BSO17_05960 [Rhizobium ruizarguesonis]